MIRLSITAGIFILLLTSCNNAVLISDEFSMTDRQWPVGEEKSIEFNVPDTSAVYQMELEVTHTKEYGFQNLYTRIRTSFPSGKEQSSITSLELAAANGSWSGDCGGRSCKVTLPLQQRFRFPETGNYTWSIEPYMRIDTVKGIERIRVVCKKVKA